MICLALVAQLFFSRDIIGGKLLVSVDLTIHIQMDGRSRLAMVLLVRNQHFKLL